MKMRLLILFLIIVGLLAGSTAAAAEACPRPAVVGLAAVGEGWG